MKEGLKTWRLISTPSGTPSVIVSGTPVAPNTIVEPMEWDDECDSGSTETEFDQVGY